MPGYDQLSSLIDDIITQAVLAEMRVATTATTSWEVDSQESPTQVRFKYTGAMASRDYTLDWSSGAVIDSQNLGPGGAFNPSGDLLAWKSKWHSNIHGLFDKFLGLPDPADFAAESTELDTTGEYLNGGGFTIGDTVFQGTNLNYYLWQVGSEKSKLDDWNGDAAVAFRDNFLKTWNSNLSNQYAARALMKICVEREKKLWTETRERIAQAADLAVAAMKAADGGGDGDAVAIAILGAVAGMVSCTIPVAGQVTLALAVGALSVADTMSKEEEKPDLQFGADTPDGVFEKMTTGIDDLDGEVTDAEYAIYLTLVELQGALVARTAFLGKGADSLVGSTDPGDIALRGTSSRSGRSTTCGSSGTSASRPARMPRSRATTVPSPRPPPPGPARDSSASGTTEQPTSTATAFRSCRTSSSTTA